MLPKYGPIYTYTALEPLEFHYGMGTGTVHMSHKVWCATLIKASTVTSKRKILNHGNTEEVNGMGTCHAMCPVCMRKSYTILRVNHWSTIRGIGGSLRDLFGKWEHIGARVGQPKILASKKPTIVSASSNYLCERLRSRVLLSAPWL
jgi:hypothetical protein